MKNSNLPIIQALKNKNKPTAAAPLPSFEPPRTFEIHHSEIPGLAGHQVGEHFSVNLKGRIHSQHADGHAIMNVSSVKPDSLASNEKENSSEKE